MVSTISIDLDLDLIGEEDVGRAYDGHPDVEPFRDEDDPFRDNDVG